MTRTTAGKSAGRPANTAVSASWPPAEAAMATTHRGGRRHAGGQSPSRALIASPGRALSGARRADTVSLESIRPVGPMCVVPPAGSVPGSGPTGHHRDRRVGWSRPGSRSPRARPAGRPSGRGVRVRALPGVGQEHPSMPRSAIDHVAVDHVVPLAEMGKLLVELVHENLSDDPVTRTQPGHVDLLATEDAMVAMDPGIVRQPERPGVPSPFSCPDCGGVLWELEDGAVLRFRCRTGHAWTAASLVAQQETAVEDALWAALRALEETAAHNQRLADRAGDVQAVRRRFLARADAAHQQGDVIRQMLVGSPLASQDEDSA